MQHAVSVVLVQKLSPCHPGRPLKDPNPSNMEVEKEKENKAMVDLQAVKESFENAGKSISSSIDSLPPHFYDPFILHGVSILLVQPGRILCSFKVPPRLLNVGNFLHGGAIASLVDLVGSAAIYTAGAPTSGVSLEINVSYLDAAYADEEIEIEGKVLRVGKTIGVVSVELRKKTGKIIAQGRHTKYLAATSKL